jgi:hypothetical protein
LGMVAYETNGGRRNRQHREIGSPFKESPRSADLLGRR